MLSYLFICRISLVVLFWLESPIVKLGVFGGIVLLLCLELLGIEIRACDEEYVLYL